MKHNDFELAKKALEESKVIAFPTETVMGLGVFFDDFDAYNFNEHQIPRLLIVNPFNGLDDVTAERAVELLNSNG